MPYAVVDLETTGFSPARGDRILEVGIVLADDAGAIEHEWATLVNPGRGVGATHVHGIRDSDVAGAPDFSEVAEHVAALVSGRTVVAHNQSFDMRFLRAELANAGLGIPDRYAALCTMVWSKRVFGPGKLGDVCDLLGIDIANAHEALDDARATAEIVRELVVRVGSMPAWRQAVANGVFPPHPRGMASGVRTKRRRAVPA